MGPLGTGMAGKIARNLLYFCSALVDWEAARLAVEAGIDVERFVEFVKGAEDKVSPRLAHVTPQTWTAAQPATVARALCQQGSCGCARTRSRTGGGVPTAMLASEEFSTIK